MRRTTLLLLLLRLKVCSIETYWIVCTTRRDHPLRFRKKTHADRQLFPAMRGLIKQEANVFHNQISRSRKEADSDEYYHLRAACR